MDRRYSNRNNALAENPYVGLNVDFFDQKALEKQARHDAARETYSKAIQGIAEQPYLDNDARQQYLQMQEKAYEDVISKHAGNLSAGYHDILKTVEQAKTNPYHNLNKRHVEQELLRQKLNAEFGSEAIDLTTPIKSLYTRDKDGNIQWEDPNKIKANVVKADDYARILEDMLKDLSAKKWQTQTGLNAPSGNAYYLASKITKGETLTPNDLMNLANDPYIQQAFLANANTAGFDNRKVAGSNDTYQSMFSDKQKLANWIYGNIQDKQKNDMEVGYQFVTNHSAVEALRAAKAKEQAQFEAFIKNIPQGGYSADVPFAIGAKVNASVLDKTKADVSKDKAEAYGTADAIHSRMQEVQKILGFQLQPGKLYSHQDMLEFRNPDKTFNTSKISAQINKKYGLDPNINLAFDNYNPATVDPEKLKLAKNDYERVVNGFADVEEMENIKRTKERSYQQKESYVTMMDNALENRAFTEAIADPNYGSQYKELIKKYNIKSIQDLNDKFIVDHTGFLIPDPTKMDFKDIKGLNYLITDVKNNYEKQKTEGMNINQVLSVVGNSSDKAASNEFNKFLGEQVNKVGLERTLGMFQTLDGKTLGDFYQTEDGKSISEILKKNAEETNKDEKYNYVLEPYVASPNVNNTGLTTHLVLRAYDKNNKPVDDKTIFMPNTKLNPTYKALEEEYAIRNLTEQNNSYQSNPGYKLENVERAKVTYGQVVAGEELNNAVQDLSSPDVKDTKRAVEFVALDGNKHTIYITKDIDGMYGLIDAYGNTVMDNRDPGRKYKMRTQEDILSSAASLIGEETYNSNPNLGYESIQIPRSAFKTGTSFSNYVYKKDQQADAYSEAVSNE